MPMPGRWVARGAVIDCGSNAKVYGEEDEGAIQVSGRLFFALFGGSARDGTTSSLTTNEGRPIPESNPELIGDTDGELKLSAGVPGEGRAASAAGPPLRAAIARKRWYAIAVGSADDEEDVLDVATECACDRELLLLPVSELPPCMERRLLLDLRVLMV